MNPLRFVAPALMVAALGAAAVGCDTSEPPAARATPTTAASSASATATGAAASSGSHTASMGTRSCEMHMPGDLLDEDQAVVEFDRESVCLGYVTVRAGTLVSWRNVDDVAHVVTLVDEDDQQIAQLDVEADGVAGFRPPAEGVLRFRLSAIETFVGTVEVQE